MKIFSKLIFVLAAASMAFTACNKELQEYKAGDPEIEGCYGVFFPTQEASGSHTYDPTAEKKITIQVSRENSKGAITVPYVMKSDVENVFNAGQITFADGQAETTLEVSFPNITIGEKSSFSLTITDHQYASLYGEGAISFDCSILCVEWQYVLDPQTKEPALFTWAQGWWGETCWGYVKYYEVGDVRTCQTVSTKHHYVNKAGEDVYYDANGFWGYDDCEWTFYWYYKTKNSNGGSFIQVPCQFTGYYSSTYSSDVYYMDYCYLDNGPVSHADYIKWAQDNEDVAAYYDNNGGFYFAAKYYYMFGVGGWSADLYETVGIGSGFVRVDYDLETESDFSVDGVLPYYLEAGKDVASIKYAAYEGSLTPTQISNKVAAIISGSDKSEEIIPSAEEFDKDENKYLIAKGLTLPKTGAYTIVSVGFDSKKAAQSSSSVECYYVAKGDIEANAVKLTVATEDTPARYEGYKPYSSFAFYICGKELTDVHVAVLESSKVTTAKLLAIKSDSSYAVSEALLEAINADGGFYTVLSKLKADTEYAVVVWATNGALDKMSIATYKTASAPAGQTSLGTGEFNDKLDMSSLVEFEREPMAAEFSSASISKSAKAPSRKGYKAPLQK